MIIPRRFRRRGGREDEPMEDGGRDSFGDGMRCRARTRQETIVEFAIQGTAQGAVRVIAGAKVEAAPIGECDPVIERMIRDRRPEEIAREILGRLLRHEEPPVVGQRIAQLDQVAKSPAVFELVEIKAKFLEQRTPRFAEVPCAVDSEVKHTRWGQSACQIPQRAPGRRNVGENAVTGDEVVLTRTVLPKSRAVRSAGRNWILFAAQNFPCSRASLSDRVEKSTATISAFGKRLHNPKASLPVPHPATRIRRGSGYADGHMASIHSIGGSRQTGRKRRDLPNGG